MIFFMGMGVEGTGGGYTVQNSYEKYFNTSAQQKLQL